MECVVDKNVDVAHYVTNTLKNIMNIWMVTRAEMGINNKICKQVYCAITKNYFIEG